MSAHLCGELITLPAPQPMLYSYDFNFMAELKLELIQLDLE
jgi:hypothetical protein